MGLFDKFKKNEKKEEKPKIVTQRIYAISKKKKLIGHFEQAKNWRGFKRINIPNRHYQEAIDNLDYFRTTKDATEGQHKGSGDRLILDGCLIDIYLSTSLEEKHPVICVYVDDRFIGANIVASDRAQAVLDGLQNGGITAVHVVVNYGYDYIGEMAYDTYLTTNIAQK